MLKTLSKLLDAADTEYWKEDREGAGSVLTCPDAGKSLAQNAGGILFSEGRRREDHPAQGAGIYPVWALGRRFTC